MCWLRIFSERALYLSIKFVLLLTWVVVISLPCRLEALDNIEIYLAGYGMATQPSNQGLSFNGKGVSDERIQGDPGLGVKIGLFPSFFHGYVGMELESFGQNNSLRFPVVGNGIATTKGKSGLITYSSMVNLLLRYPGRYVRPYAGIGGGSRMESSTMRIFQVEMTKILKWHRLRGISILEGFSLSFSIGGLFSGNTNTVLRITTGTNSV